LTSQIFEQIDSLGETKIHEKNSKNGINALKNFTNQNLNTEKEKTLNQNLNTEKEKTLNQNLNTEKRKL